MRVEAPPTPLDRQWAAGEAPPKPPSAVNAAAAGSVAPALASGLTAADAAGGQSGGDPSGQGDTPFGDEAAWPLGEPVATIQALQSGPTAQDISAFRRLIDRIMADLAKLDALAHPNAGVEAQALDDDPLHVDLKV